MVQQPGCTKNAGKIDLEVVDLPAQIGEKDWVGWLWWLDSRAESYAGMGFGVQPLRNFWV